MKVLFLSVPTGQGHHQTAKAVLEYFKSNEDVECRFLDVVDDVSPMLADSLQQGYLLSTKMTPRIYGRIYDMADQRNQEKSDQEKRSHTPALADDSPAYTQGLDRSQDGGRQEDREQLPCPPGTDLHGKGRGASGSAGRVASQLSP